jgi:hypothetical protein
MIAQLPLAHAEQQPLAHAGQHSVKVTKPPDARLGRRERGTL